MNKPEFDITYSQLPAQLYAHTKPDPAPNAAYVWLNNSWAQSIGLDQAWLSSDDALGMFSGTEDVEGYAPLAMAYSGHQFGHFSAQLGDGRALLIGEIVGSDATRYDLHLKGSGSTVYSRRGDGKSTLRAALKEALFSEYMAAIGISATRTLAVFETGEMVMREEAHKGAVLLRAAKSLIRVGTFEFANIMKGEDIVKKLADFLIVREYTDIDIEANDRHQQLFTQIVTRQAELIAKWMSQGFIHGVMNSDNMALSGETIDFGPCAFMERFKPNQVFSSIDKNGRYAWNRQAEMAMWNLSKLAQSLLDLFDENQETAIQIAEEELNKFFPQFMTHFNQLIMHKLGLSIEGAQAEDMMNQTFAMLSAAKPDYTLFFRYLGDVLMGEDESLLVALCADEQPLQSWLSVWRGHIENEAITTTEIAQNMQQINPIYVPRFQLIERALEQAGNGELTAFNHLLKALQNPYIEAGEFADYLFIAADGDADEQTFCET
ncbi:MAG: YdiU family protein [Alphaproteobacteria bacterium]|nr:YdiU family protein [Alphaproteobacteria bacterium]